MRDFHGRGVAVLILCSVMAFGQGASSWRDLSPHRVQFVKVDDGVQLEVLIGVEPGDRSYYSPDTSLPIHTD